MFGGLVIKGVRRLGSSILACHSLLAGEESSSSGQGHRLQLGRRSWSNNRSANRGGRTYSSCTMLRKDRRNPGPPTGNWQTRGGCQGAAMVRQYINSGGRGYGVCQEREKESGVVLVVSQYSTRAQDTIAPLLLQSKGLSVGSFLWALFQVALAFFQATKQGICGQPWERAVDEVAWLAVPRVPTRAKAAWSGKPRTLKNDKTAEIHLFHKLTQYDEQTHQAFWLLLLWLLRP
ncbi:hypothetical protein Q5P01_026105 [Channa striata]|uniref:Uncharacterized protein n=1 Tax=Channa striata TaxID=64152 RepID=A0AA88IFS6_CHASR|nr:hypothetical protein Q5P01_026105 [Channa striata]